ncbi:cytochrome P450 [Xylariaceae sp. FL0804]|nr:cytochrome P450 [Xylariaceae sp. FL0804]
MSTPIPQPPGVPLLGNLFDVDPNNTWGSLKRLAERYGEIFQIKVLGRAIVFVASAALAEELCDERRFRKFVGGPIVEIRYAVHDALFTAFEHEEASWGVAHRIMAPRLLAPSALAARFADDVLEPTDRLLARWRRLAEGPPRSNEVSVLAELNRLNLEATTMSLFGQRLDGLDGPPHPMLQAMEDATSEAMKRPTRPALLNWLWYGGKFKRATAEMRAYAAAAVRHRAEHPTDRQDLLAALTAGRDPKTGAALTESQVIDEIVSMPIGSSTAPGMLATAVYFLLRNPEAAARARAELDAVVGAGPLTHEHLARLPYVEGVMRESLRLSFAAPGFNIEPVPQPDKTPVQLAGGKYQVAHDQAMIIVLAGVNRDPAVFADPLAFRPERMMGDEFARLPPGAKKWFGNGKRECIGKHWARQFSMTVLARLIAAVDFEMVDPKYQLQQDGWFNLRPVDFYVRVKPRDN